MINEVTNNSLKSRVQKLGLWGLIAEWDEVSSESWLTKVIEYEEAARSGRSLERRLKAAKLGKFKPMTDYDWTWPKEIDREAIEELFKLNFVKEAVNVLVIGQNGTGKTMIAKNLAHQALLNGCSALFTTASQLLNDLGTQDSPSALHRRLRFYAHPQILVIDELGYLATSSEHADLLFELVTRRYEQKSTVITSNKPFNEWSEVFPNASCVVALVDRLIHKAEIVHIVADSYRLREARKWREERKLAREPQPKRKKA